MKYLLDTNACVAHLRSGGKSKVSQKLVSSSAGDVVLCSVVVAELLYGAKRSADVARNLAEVKRFVSGFVSIPFDDPAAGAAADVRASLATSGSPIGPYDLLIASTALTHRLTLVTHNTGEFGRVPGLLVEDWEV